MNTDIYNIYSDKTDDELVAMLYLGEKYYIPETLNTIKQILINREFDIDNYINANASVIIDNKKHKKYYDKCKEYLIYYQDIIEYDQHIIDVGKSILKEHMNIENPNVIQVIDFVEEFKVAYKKQYTKLILILVAILIVIITIGYLI